MLHVAEFVVLLFVAIGALTFYRRTRPESKWLRYAALLQIAGASIVALGLLFNGFQGTGPAGYGILIYGTSVVAIIVALLRRERWPRLSNRV